MLETLIQKAFNHFQKAKNSNQTRTKKRTTKKKKKRFGYWFGNGSGMFDKTRLANVDIKVFVKAVLVVRVFFNCCTKKIHTVFVTKNNSIITIKAVKKVKKICYNRSVKNE